MNHKSKHFVEAFGQELSDAIEQAIQAAEKRSRGVVWKPKKPVARPEAAETEPEPHWQDD